MHKPTRGLPLNNKGLREFCGKVKGTRYFSLPVAVKGEELTAAEKE